MTEMSRPSEPIATAAAVPLPKTKFTVTGDQLVDLFMNRETAQENYAKLGGLQGIAKSISADLEKGIPSNTVSDRVAVSGGTNYRKRSL